MKKTVFLTGATGTMGWAGLQELLKHDNKLDIVILARHSQKNIEKLKPLQDRIKIVWGDLTNYEDVLKGVTGADYVLHVGGMVSPSADYFPEKTLKVNTTAAANVVKAIQAQPNADDIRAVYIGSVAQTSDRGPDNLWGRTGDPIFSSVYDYYGISKIIAERTFAESGLKHWVSLRQSGILYPAILKQYDPIMFHVPITGVLEWATVEDSGRLLANLCTLDLPNEFWNRFYNISSGPDYRLSNFEFETLLLDAIHCPGPKKIFNANWFVLRNFHGQFYLDADKLEQYLHFRANIPVKDYFRQMGERMPKFFKLAKIVPAPIIKAAMLPMAYKKKYGTQWWLKHNDEQHINAYFGGREAWEKIPDWEDIDLHVSKDPADAKPMDHGYDEQKPLEQLTLEELRQAGAFRGSTLLSTEYDGNPEKPLEWQCHDGHHYRMSPKLMLWGGHPCPECLPPIWNYDHQAKHNPFFAQAWYAHHSPDENNIYENTAQ